MSISHRRDISTFNERENQALAEILERHEFTMRGMSPSDVAHVKEEIRELNQLDLKIKQMEDNPIYRAKLYETRSQRELDLVIFLRGEKNDQRKHK